MNQGTKIKLISIGRFAIFNLVLKYINENFPHILPNDLLKSAKFVTIDNDEQTNFSWYHHLLNHAIVLLKRSQLVL